MLNLSRISVESIIPRQSVLVLSLKIAFDSHLDHLSKNLGAASSPLCVKWSSMTVIPKRKSHANVVKFNVQLHSERKSPSFSLSLCFLILLFFELICSK